MSCSMELSIWYDECCAEAEAEADVEVEVMTQTPALVLAAQVKTRSPDDDPWVSFQTDIKDRAKTTFGKTHLKRAKRFANPDIGYGYEISCDPPLTLKKTTKFSAMTWSSAILCGYDPKRDNIMFEVCRERERDIYSYHTMKMSKFEKDISGNQIAIIKI